jgi:hypothetical protein
MSKELPLKIDICSQFIYRVIVAEATYEAYVWIGGALRG